jgi:flavin-dependent dehydrogenase
VEPVVVIGGGPAGSAAAMELARLGRPAVLIERTGYGGLRIGETLPPAALPLLADLGLAETLRSQEPLECQGIWSAWGSSDLFEKSFLFNPYGHGWHLDRGRFDAALVEAAARQGARVCLETRVRSCAADPRGGWSLVLSQGGGEETLRAAAVLDASGRASWLARRLGAGRVSYDRQIGFAALCPGPGGLEPVTLVEAAENGWWYSAPLPQGDLVVVYLTDADLVHPGGANTASRWTSLLAETCYTRARVACAGPPGTTRAFMADTYRTALAPGPALHLSAGAAAVGLDPLSSNGICFALGSGRDAARALAAHLAGDSEAVSTYLRSLDETFATYWSERLEYYRAETRWSAAPFWQRRQSLPDQPPTASATRW